MFTTHGKVGTTISIIHQRKQLSKAEEDPYQTFCSVVFSLYVTISLSLNGIKLVEKKSKDERNHLHSSSLTSLTPAPSRRHCVLLEVMWSSAEVLEDESSAWLSTSLSLSSMEANTALSIQTHNRTQTRAYSHQHPSVRGWSYGVHPAPPPVPSLHLVPDKLSCPWTSWELLLQRSPSSVNSSLPSMLIVCWSLGKPEVWNGPGEEKRWDCLIVLLWQEKKLL